MSGALSSILAPDPDIVTIVIGNSTLSGWQTVRVMRSIEHFPSFFEIELTEAYPTQPQQIIINPGDPCVVMLGSDPVLTGYVDDYAASMDSDSHTVRISGRSKCLDLLDCTAGSPPYQYNNTTLVALAKKLAQPYGVTVSAPDGDSALLPSISVNITDPPYSVLEHFARWANFLIYDDPGGNLVIGKVGDVQAGSGFVQGQNVQAASVRFSMQDRYTEIEAVFVSTAFLIDPPPAAGSSGPVIPFIPGAQVKDTSFPKRADGQPRFRRLLFVSEQSTNSPTFAAQRAQWEMARRVGRSQAVHVTCDSWRDASGKLWAPNSLAPLDLPAVKVSGVTWLISTVTFLRNGQAGTTAQIVLMPKTAFVPEPENLLPFDATLGQALPGGSGGYAPAPRN